VIKAFFHNVPELAAQAAGQIVLLGVLVSAAIGAVLGVVGLGFVLFSGPLIRLFIPEPEVAAFGVRSLWIISLAFPFHAAGMCFEGAFNGAGDTWTPARLNFLCLWLCQIPMAGLLSQSFGTVGAVISVPAAFALLTLLSWALFRRGRWKLQKV
jgi:Na+-driven multidrug efflux pump